MKICILFNIQILSLSFQFGPGKYFLRGWRHSALTWSHDWDVFNYNVRWNKIDMLELKKWQYLCKTPSCDTKVMLCWIKILPIFPGQWKRWGLLIEVWWCLFCNWRPGKDGLGSDIRVAHRVSAVEVWTWCSKWIWPRSKPSDPHLRHQKTSPSMSFR